MARRSLLGLLGLAGLAACTTSPAGTTPAPRPGTPEPVPLRYGPDPSQYAVLHLPPGDPGEGPEGALPVVVVIHGGYWRAAYGLELGTPLAVDLTNADVAAAVDLLATQGVETARRAGRELDLRSVVLLGHSAGGHLAAWAGSRSRLQAPAPGADPVVVPRGVVSQAGVLDLVAAAQQDLGGGATQDLLGGDPVTQAARYAVASPTALVPASCPVVAVHGTADTTVPIDQSRRYVAAATAARGQARLVELPGVDHFDLIDPAAPAWQRVREETLGLLR